MHQRASDSEVRLLAVTQLRGRRYWSAGKGPTFMGRDLHGGEPSHCLDANVAGPRFVHILRAIGQLEDNNRAA